MGKRSITLLNEELDLIASARGDLGLEPARNAAEGTEMTKIVRTEPNKILAKAVEFHGFVYLQGCTARDSGKDIKGQTTEFLPRSTRSWRRTALTRAACCKPRSGSRTSVTARQ